MHEHRVQRSMFVSGMSHVLDVRPTDPSGRIPIMTGQGSWMSLDKVGHPLSDEVGGEDGGGEVAIAAGRAAGDEPAKAGCDEEKEGGDYRQEKPKSADE